MEMSIGLDVSVQETSVCALGRDGEIVAETTMVTDPQVLAHGLSRLPGSMGAVGLEAGPMSPWLCKGLRDRGYTVVLMETRRIKAALKAVPVKTDRRDALGIAHLLRMGWFQPVHCKSDRSQAIRVLLGARRSLVQSITRLELSMRGLLRNFGLRLGGVAKGDYDACVRTRTSDHPCLSPVCSERFNRCCAHGRRCARSCTERAVLTDHPDSIATALRLRIRSVRLS